MKRRTIQREVSLSGIGLHKGEKIEITLKPNGDDSKTGRGIIFADILLNRGRNNFCRDGSSS